MIIVAFIDYPNKQQDFSAFITFSSQGSSCPSPAYLLISISAFLAEKFLSHVAARLIRKYWVPNFRQSFRHYSPSPHPYLPLFATIRHYSQLFATIRHYSLFAIRDCSLFAFAVRYSLFAIRDYSLFAIRVFQTPSMRASCHRARVFLLCCT